MAGLDNGGVDVYRGEGDGSKRTKGGEEGEARGEGDHDWIKN